MKTAYRVCFIILLLIAVVQPGMATWSIIMADTRTKQIGIAGASCTANVYGIGLIAPGKGAVVVQAMSNGMAKLKGFEMIMAGKGTEEILKTLRQPQFNPEAQQYAILTLNEMERPLTYTGTNTIDSKGSLTGNGISVQGNTLASQEVLQAVFDAASKAMKDSLPLQEVLMLAMEAGAKAGGDKRCGERKASSAFLTVCKPEDVDKYWLNLIVYGTDNRIHAVDELRRKYDQWKIDNKSGK